MIPILDILTPVIGKILDFIPDPKAKAEAQMKIQEELMAHENDILKVMQASDQGQAAVNTEEAKSASLFISGWRPFLGWTCGAAFAWQYVLLPLSAFVMAQLRPGVTINLPAIDFSQMSTVLMGMLGLAGLRTYEKQQGVQSNH